MSEIPAVDWILGIETSTHSTQCALGVVDASTPSAVEILGSLEDDQPKRHCENLVPMISKLLKEHKSDIYIREPRKKGKRGGTSKRNSAGLVAVDLGPGLYTGLRVGIATAVFWAYGMELPVAGFSSLELLAYQGFSASPVSALLPGTKGLRAIAVLDARRGEVFYGGYELRGQMMTQKQMPLATFLEPGVLKPAELAELLQKQNLTEGAALVGDTSYFLNSLESDTAKEPAEQKPIPLSFSRILPDTPRAESLIHLAAQSQVQFQNQPPSQNQNLTPIYLRRPDTF